MKVVLAMVMSVDGRTTKWNNPNIYEWTSQEDKKHFFSLIEKNNVIIMGRKTYEAAASVMKLTPSKLRIVLTESPKVYADKATARQLEFTDESPKALIKRFEDRGYKQALLVGGERINEMFFKAKLINEVWVTIEPRFFGTGNGLVAEYKLDVKMRLKNVKIINKAGTLLLKYQVSQV